MSSAWTSSAGVSNEIRVDPSSASLARCAALRGILTRVNPGASSTSFEPASRPLMSGDHGGTVPSAGAHAVIP